MEKEKYFTPEMQDFYLNYEFELQTNKGWKKGIFPNLIEEESDNFGLVEKYKQDIFMKLAHAITRVPFLTKEQIENEGWEFTEQINNKLYFKKGAFVLTFEDDYINIDNTKGQDIGYWGKCKDINTFRYICKLLEI